MSWILLFLLLTILFVVNLLAKRWQIFILARFILAIQSIYLLIGVVLRSLVLIVVNPSPSFGDFVADRRLLKPKYINGLSPLLGVTILGILCYSTVFLLISRKLTDYKNLESILELSFIEKSVNASYACLFLSIVSVISQIFFGSIKVLIWFSDMALPSAFILVVLQVHQQSKFKRLRAFLFSGVVMLYLSIINLSKTPFLAFVLAIGFYWTLIITTNKKQNNLTIKRIGFLLAIPILAFYSFNKIQTLKQAEVVNTIDKRISVDYLKIDFLYPILKRFDILRSIADSYYVDSTTWFTSWGVLGRIVDALSWNLDSTYLTFGAQWSLNLGKSFNTENPTPLSVHFIAEGFRAGSTFGVAAFSAIYALLTAFLLQKTSKNFFTLAVGASVITSGFLFENGLLQFFEAFAKGMRVGILMFIFYLFSHSYSKITERR